MTDESGSRAPSEPTLQRLSDGMADAVERAAASVVRVAGRRGYALSGVILDEDLVITTSRAVEQDADLTIGIGEAREPLAGDLVGVDPLTDLALVRVPGLDGPAATFVPAADARVGQLVLRVGRSSGSPEATLGLVRRVGGTWRSPWGARFPVRLVTDAVPFRGFSGGAVATIAGAFLGLGTAALSRSRADVIPSETVVRVAADLREHGRVRRPYLGVSIQPVTLPADAATQAGRERGLLVSGIDDGAPAAGTVAIGDVLLALDDDALAAPAELVGLLEERAPGTRATLRLLRGGEVRSVEVELGARR